MDIELLKALADLPVVVILIYLLIKAWGENEKLLAALIEAERCHAKDLVDIIVSGRVVIDKPLPHSADNPVTLQNTE